MIGDDLLEQWRARCREAVRLSPTELPDRSVVTFPALLADAGPVEFILELNEEGTWTLSDVGATVAHLMERLVDWDSDKHRVAIEDGLAAYDAKFEQRAVVTTLDHPPTLEDVIRFVQAVTTAAAVEWDPPRRPTTRPNYPNKVETDLTAHLVDRPVKVVHREKRHRVPCDFALRRVDEKALLWAAFAIGPGATGTDQALRSHVWNTHRLGIPLFTVHDPSTHADPWVMEVAEESTHVVPYNPAEEDVGELVEAMQGAGARFE